MTSLKGLKGYKKFNAVVSSDILRIFPYDTDRDDSTDSRVNSTEELIDLLEG